MPIDWDDAANSTLAPLGSGGSGVVPKDESRVGGATDWDTVVQRSLAPMAGSDVALAPMRGSSAGSWSAGSNFLDSLLLGYGKNLGAMTPGPSEARSGVLSNYSDRLKKLKSEQESYRAANPREALGTEVAGGLVGTTAALALGQDYLAAPAAARLTALAPRLAPAMEFLGGSAGAYGTGLRGALTKSGSLAARGGVEGGASGVLQSHIGEGTVEEQATVGGELGATLNPLLGPAASRLASRIPANAAEAAQGAIRQGVPLRAGELPGVSPIVSTLDKVFSGAKNAPEREAFYNAVTTQAGLPSKVIDQNWVAKADALNGGTMSRIASAYHLDPLDPALNSDLAHLDAAAHGALPNDSYKKFSELRKKIDDELNTGAVPGSVYQNWTQKGGLISSFAKDPTLRPFVTGPGSIKEAIDNAWERSIQNSGAPTAAQDYGAWQQARKQWKNTRIVDEDVNEAGDYNPQKLLSRIQSRYGSAKKAGELGDLGTAGQFIYKPEKPPAQASHSLISRFGSGTAALGGAALLGGAAEHVAEPMARMVYHDPELGMLGVGSILTGYGAAKGANSILSSPTYTKHLLDIAQGNAKPWLRGVNPLIPGVIGLVNNGQ